MSFCSLKKGLPRKLANCLFVLISSVFCLFCFLTFHAFVSGLLSIVDLYGSWQFPLFCICTSLGSFLYSASAPLLAVSSILHLHLSWQFPLFCICTALGSFLNRRFLEIAGKDNLTVFSYSGRVKSPEWRR